MSTIKIKAKHAIVTPTCQTNKGTHSAGREAADRLITEYLELARLDVNKGAKFHFVLEVERETKPDG